MAHDLGNLAGIGAQHLEQLGPLRQLILDTAVSIPSVGALEESMKWGERSYAPAKKGIGSSVRIAPRKDGNVAVNFICHTGLIERFRELYAQALVFEGNRTIVIDPAKPLPEHELRHCFGMALTYHLSKR